jgi:hypothetical protein
VANFSAYSASFSVSFLAGSAASAISFLKMISLAPLGYYGTLMIPHINLFWTSDSPLWVLGARGSKEDPKRKKRGIIEEAMRWHIPIIFL